TTNLSCSQKTLESVVQHSGPERLKWNTSFHPYFTSLEEFLPKVEFLKDKGYEVLVMYVAYPPQLKRLPFLKDVFRKKNINFFAQAYQGDYAGLTYPAAYSTEERELIYGKKDYVRNGNDNIGLKKLIENQLAESKTKGKLCLAGYKYAFVDSTGIMYRCTRERKHPIGDFLKQPLKLLDNPLPCEFEKCPCEFTWLVDEDKWRKEHKQDNAPHAVALASSSTQARSYPVPGKVFWNWDIHYACNYKCSYCWLHKPHKEEPKDRHPYPGIDVLLKIWSNIYNKYGRCHIHISGGEPSMYPLFNNFLAELTQIHSVEFDSNLSFEPAEFLKHIKPGMVKINASFQPEFADFNTFIRKVRCLKENQFEIGMSYVAYPTLLDKMEKYRDLAKENNLNFTIQAYRGDFNGKQYPDAYSDEEKKLVGICGNDSTQKILHHHTEDAKNSEKRLCRMGQLYGKIYPNGDLLRCCVYDKQVKMDNVYENPDFKLLDEPTYCEVTPCPCWRAMIVGKETEWGRYWYSLEKK
ncbi:MAG: radical SAM protein, partial [Candidatus Omnitrophica bacterium]|nr:radical SAM protein [Candidatus Omnitrophota bacterium]